MRLPIQMWYGIGNLELLDFFSSIRYSNCLSTVSLVPYLNPMDGWLSAVGILHKPPYVLKLHSNYSARIEASIEASIQIKHSSVLDSHYFVFWKNSFVCSDNDWTLAVVKMDSNLYCSQYKDVDRSALGTATTTDENGTTVRRSTREIIQ